MHTMMIRRMGVTLVGARVGGGRFEEGNERVRDRTWQGRSECEREEGERVEEGGSDEGDQLSE